MLLYQEPELINSGRRAALSCRATCPAGLYCISGADLIWLSCSLCGSRNRLIHKNTPTLSYRDVLDIMTEPDPLKTVCRKITTIFEDDVLVDIVGWFFFKSVNRTVNRASFDPSELELKPCVIRLCTLNSMKSPFAVFSMCPDCIARIDKEFSNDSPSKA
jgi:hypothetical protein